MTESGIRAGKNVIGMLQAKVKSVIISVSKVVVSKLDVCQYIILFKTMYISYNMAYDKWPFISLLYLMIGKYHNIYSFWV